MEKKRYRALIFDMDGVIVNTEPHHLVIERKLFSGLGLEISDEEHREYLGISSLSMWKKIAAKHKLQISAGDLTSRNIEEIHRYFSGLEMIDLIPGIDRILSELYIHGIPMAVASGTDIKAIELLLTRTGVRKFFSHIVSSEMLGKSKPDPAIYLHTAGLLSADPCDCIVIEDSPNGILAAKRAGMYCIAYNPDLSASQNQSAADEITSDFNLLGKTIVNRFVV